MVFMNVRQLLDTAISSSNRSNVNFSALHCLLYSFADKLRMLDEPVDCAKFGYQSIQSSFHSNSEMNIRRSFPMHSTKRLKAGMDTEPEPDDRIVEVSEEKIVPISNETTDISTTVKPTEAIIDTTQDSMAVNVSDEPPSVHNSQHEMEYDHTGEIVEFFDDATSGGINMEPLSNIDQLTVTLAPRSNARFKRFKTTPIVIKEIVNWDPDVDKEPDDESLVPKIIPKPIREKHIEKREKGPKLPPMVLEQEHLPQEILQNSVNIMKDQLGITMEQLHKITKLVIRDKKKLHTKQEVRDIDHILTEIKYDNTMISGTQRFSIISMDTESSSSSSEGELDEEEVIDIHEPEKSGYGAHDLEDLDLHLCYSPEKLLNQLLELKAEFCVLSNKMNNLSAAVLAMDSNRTKFYIQELQEQFRDLKLSSDFTRSQLDAVEVKIANNSEMIYVLQGRVQTLTDEKIDKTEVAILLAQKVNYKELETKASIQQLREVQCTFEEKICRLEKSLCRKEKVILEMIAEMNERLGLARIEELLANLKTIIDADIQSLKTILQSYIDATNDDCAAAGGRVKVLQDLACFTCDTTCVMRSREKAPVSKLATSKGSNSIAPLITYELGNIRKSGTVGYFRKDEFPNSPNAWLDRQKHNFKTCLPVPRYAGGPITTHTAKDMVEKVLHQK